MKIALYNENLGELEILLGQLDQCAREYLRFVEITPYVRQEDFCSLVRDGPEVDLFVVAQDGTFSLEIVELLMITKKRMRCQSRYIRLIWSRYRKRTRKHGIRPIPCCFHS